MTPTQLPPLEMAASEAELAANHYERRGRWLDNWHPEDEAFWQSGGRRTALKNLLLSVTSEHLGFNVWVLWTVLVTFMGNAGFEFLDGLNKAAPEAIGNALLLTSVPVLVGAALRIPYTFAVPKFGGRAFTTFSAGMLLLPTLGIAYFINQPDTPLAVFVVLAALTGFGGGNFSSSMANISFFFPERRKGMALGINAAAGNIGVAVCQLAAPLIVLLGTSIMAKDAAGYRFGITLAVLFWVPLILLAVAASWRYMDSISAAKPDGSSYRLALTTKHTWVMSAIYTGTFGSFIGFSFAFPTLIKANFPDLQHNSTMVALGNLAFLGAFVGALIRPVGGWLADHHAGAHITVLVFGAMALDVFAIIGALELKSFALFFIAFMLMFILAGIGNGSAYRMIPMIFVALTKSEVERGELDESEAAFSAKRRAGAAVGVIGAIGAFGGFLVQQALRISNKELHSMNPAFWAYLGVFAALGAVTWWFYMRRTFAIDRMPSLAHERI